MSGLAGRFFAGGPGSGEPERRRLAGSFAGHNCEPLSYADADVELFVAGRFAPSRPSGGGWSRSFGELVESPRYVLAFEGYILNLAEIATAGLEASMGRGTAILELFARTGPALFEQLNGGYSAIIWDKSEKVATVGNCRLGQRNLYRVATGPGVTLASDLQALRSISRVEFELDRDTSCTSFMYGSVYGAATPIRSVSRVLPGTTLTIGRSSITEVLTRDLPRQPETPTRQGAQFYLEQLDVAMRQAARRLAHVADSHAVMLGSGVDSSLVAAYAKGEVSDLLALTQQMPGDTDESRGAARISDALGMTQTIVSYAPTSDTLVDEVSAFVRIAEEPAYWNQLGPPLLHLLNGLEERPDAYLTGAEGDFLFNFRSTTGPSVSQVIKDGLFWPVATYTARRLVNRVTRHTYIVGSDFDLLDRHFMADHVAVDCRAQLDAPGWFDPTYAHLPAGPNAQRHFINNGWQNVRIIEQFGRDVGSEVLFPYLDADVVACVLSLPAELKINKVALRMLLARFLPRHIVPKKKTGYWAHTVRWHYELGLLGGVLDLMSEQRTLERGVYRPAAVRALVDAYASKRATARCHPVLWQLLTYEMFCRQFIDGLESGT